MPIPLYSQPLPGQSVNPGVNPFANWTNKSMTLRGAPVDPPPPGVPSLAPEPIGPPAPPDLNAVPASPLLTKGINNPDVALAMLMSGKIGPADYQGMTGKPPPGPRGAAPTGAAPARGTGGGSASPKAAGDPADGQATEMEKEFRKRIDGAAGDKVTAVQDLAQTEVSKADDVAAKMQAHADAADKLAAAQADRELEATQTSQAKLADIEAQSKALAGQKLEQGHFFAQMSTPQKILAGIAAVFGARAARSGHTEALDVITKSIDQDLRIQQANIDNKKSAIGEQRSVLAQRMAQLGDQRQANAVARADMYQRAIGQIQATAAKYGAPEAQAKADALVADLEKARQEQLAAFYGNDLAKGRASIAARQQAAAAAAAHAQARREKLEDKYIDADLDISKENAKSGVGTSARIFSGVDQGGEPQPADIPARSKESADKLTTFYESWGGQKRDAQRLRELSAKPMSSVDPADAREAAMIISRLKLNEAKIQGMKGGGSDKDAETVLNTLPSDPTQIWSMGRTINRSLDAYDQNLDNKARDMKALHAAVPAKTMQQNAQALGFKPAGGK